MGKVEESIMPIALKAANEIGCELYDVEYKKEGKQWYLRLFVDTAEGIGIDTCEKYSRLISPMLDEADPIKENYILEVSSPGMFRKLTRPQHFEKYKGSEVEVKLFKTENGRKKVNGILSDYADDGTVTVQCGEEMVSLEKEKYMYVKLNPECF